MAGWAVGTRIGVGKTFSLQYAQVRLSLRFCGTRPPDSAGISFGRGLGSGPRLKTARAADVTSDEGEVAEMRRTLHGAKDEDDAPWTNLFTSAWASSKSSRGPPHPQGWGTLFCV